jgi:DNA-binding response OmpR family regulator
LFQAERIVLRVHIVEDDTAVADALLVVLSDFGHTVECYPDGETFLKTASPVSGDVVIVDVGLPGMSGDDVIRHLNGLPDVPRIIAISGKPKNALERRLSGLPEHVLLRKPLSLTVLTEHLLTA